MTQLTIDKITLGYDGNSIVKDISFCVKKGDYLSIIGENGAGKSTLLKTILLLHRPLSGNIMLGDGIRRADFGYLPQQRDVQKDFPASVYEIVISGCLNRCGLRPFYNKIEQKLALTNMDKLGIANLSKRCYRELSGGQQQRVLLARALCASSKMILLDEPVAGLDPDAAIGLYEVIESLNRNDGITVITVSHDIEAALRYSSHILKIDKGAALFEEKEKYLNLSQGGSRDDVI